MLIDPPADEFTLRSYRDSLQLFIARNCISFSLVFNRLEVKQAQVFALFPMLIGFLPDVDRRPVRNNVCSLQQSACIELARLSVRSKALGFWMVLVRVQEHEEILDDRPATVVFVSEFVNAGLGIVDIDALRTHPLIAFGRK